MPKKVVTLEAKERVYDPAKYTSYVKQSSRILYWLALLLMVVLNFLTFLLLAPLAVFLDSIQRHALVGVIGLLFGLVFNFLVQDIEHLEPKHHYFAALLIPLVAAVNLFIMTFLVNALRGIWELPLTGGAVSESLAYAIMFIIPYLATLLRGKKTTSRTQ
ncbi:hypothetical protein J4439_03660 [Candidatus Woesearchaeota archaeon]|nr:hypothetical protein [Candidatus Woesearchaeota archaeon]